MRTDAGRSGLRRSAPRLTRRPTTISAWRSGDGMLNFGTGSQPASCRRSQRATVECVDAGAAVPEPALRLGGRAARVIQRQEFEGVPVEARDRVPAAPPRRAASKVGLSLERGKGSVIRRAAGARVGAGDAVGQRVGARHDVPQRERQQHSAEVRVRRRDRQADVRRRRDRRVADRLVEVPRRPDPVHEDRGGVDGRRHLEDLREPVHRAVGGVRRGLIAADGAVAAGGGVGTGDAHSPAGRAEHFRSGPAESLGAVVLAAGERVVGDHGGIRAVVAQLVLVVGLVVPVPVVGIRVVVGDLGAIEPVDDDARAGGAGVGGGVGVRGAADHPEAVAVGPDVGVPGGGEALDKGVVVRDIVRLAVGLRRGEEQQPELLAGGDPGRNQAPAVGNLDLAGRGGAWSSFAAGAKTDHRVVHLLVGVLRRHRHDDHIVALDERGDRSSGTPSVSRCSFSNPAAVSSADRDATVAARPSAALASRSGSRSKSTKTPEGPAAHGDGGACVVGGRSRCPPVVASALRSVRGLGCTGMVRGGEFAAKRLGSPLNGVGSRESAQSSFVRSAQFPWSPTATQLTHLSLCERRGRGLDVR